MTKLCDSCLYDSLPSTHKTIKKNEYLFLENEEINNIYIIKSGLVKVSKLFPNGDEKILEILGPDDFVALLSVLKEHEAYIASAKAITDIEVEVLSKTDTLKAYNQNDQFKDACLKCAASRVNMFQNQLFESSNQDVEEKIINMLKFFYPKFGTKEQNTYIITLPISKTELASIIGIRRETLSRKLSVLEKTNQLKIHKNTYHILSM